MNIQSGIIKLADRHYPELLKAIYKPPTTLYYKGDISLLNKTCISIVGTRRCSSYGEFMTERIVRDLARYDLVIVSGLAKGVDTIAHQTALKYGIPTLAVLGSGIDNIYPKQNIPLANQILRNGLIISEHPDDTPPINYQFPQRNRIISGICLGTVVIEAPERSGALITARFALEQGRDIFVVPGDIDRPQAKGIINLLQKAAAYPIYSGEDVIQYLRQQPYLFSKLQDYSLQESPLKSALNLGPQEQLIFNSLTKTRPKTANELQKILSLPVSELLSTLSLMEIEGTIKSKKGGYVRSR